MVLANIVNMLRGAVAVNEVRKGFPKTLTRDDLIESDTALVAGKEIVVGEYEVKPQTVMRFGYGTPNQPYNQGTIYMLLKDNSATPVELDDNTEIRLVITDYNGRVKGVALSERYANLKTGATNLTERFKFPEYPVDAYQNDKLRLVIIPAAADNGKTLSKANSKIFVSATEYWIGK